MREMSFSLQHKGCWSTKIVEGFPNITATLISWVTFPHGKGRWSCLWSFEAKDEKKMKEFLDFFSHLQMVEKMEVLYTEKNVAIIHEVSHAEAESITKTIADSACHVIGVMFVRNGWEHWQVVAEKPKDLRDLLEALKPHVIGGEIVIKRIGKYEPTKTKYNLTTKQYKAITLAIANEYYSWPRRATLDELAVVSGVSRRTFQDHLRKAESKVVPAAFKENFS